jgi:2-iminobutanoate/2-iminopropanoate deaminase
MERFSNGRDKGFSNAVVLNKPGNVVFVSGEVGRDESGKLISGSFEDEVRQCFANIETALKQAGCALSDVVKLTAFLTDLNDYSGYAAVRGELFKGAYPSSSAVGVADLLLGARIEIEAIAVRET